MMLRKAFVKMHLPSKLTSAIEYPPRHLQISNGLTLHHQHFLNHGVKGSSAATATAYAASKAGVIGVTKALAAECSYMRSINKIENRIRVNSLLLPASRKFAPAVSLTFFP